METVLAKIVADKRIWVDKRKQQQPLDEFIDGLTPSDRSFEAALSGEQTAFILECKKASPSKGLIRPDFDLDHIASVYNNHANAISVLTDEKYFQGSFDFISQVRNQVSQPILCKDFMIDTYQVYLARHYGADAILLMLSVLNDDEYRELAAVAGQLELGILTEVSNEEELERAIALKTKVVGINNRNLRDLSIDLNRTKELAPRLPEGTIVISESGIHNNQQVRELSAFANGFLIGSSLMAEDNLELAVRRILLGDNKVCGLTHPDDACAAYQSGAVYGGLIFVPSSPRYVDIEQARIIMSGAPLKFVGVFRNNTIEAVAETAQALSLSAVQLHGDESPEYIQQLKGYLPADCEIWKAHGIEDSIPDFSCWPADIHLLDSKIDQQFGGTGQVFDWSLLNGTDKEKLLLAGGLNPENVSKAAQIGCKGLDMNSGVESKPGKKDKKKLDAAFAAIRKY